MNLLQSLLIFLSLVAINDGSSWLTPRKFLRELNDLRRDYAVAYNVPNMHELIASNDLEDILRPLDWKASWPEARKTWRYVKLTSFDSAISSTKEAGDAYILNPYNNTSTMDELELLNPIQRFIGCGPKTEGFRDIEVCLVGTEGDFTFFVTSRNSEKEPGSECHKRYTNEIGLCVPNNKEKESYYGHPQNIFEDVNRLRMDYSKMFNVPNMHELIWSEDLLKNLQNMHWNNGFLGAGVAWRYVHLDTYIKPSIEPALTTFFKKSPAEKWLFIRSNSDATMNSLEFLNPLQRFIACIQRLNTPSFICLLGTEGKFTMFDYSNKSREIPGSNCQKRYRNNSGVCVAINPEKESYFGRQLDFMSDINEIRRRYAKEYRVPNMHALTWSDKLAEVLEPLNFTGVRAQSRKSWRYEGLYSFDITNNHIEADVSVYFRKNRTAKELHLKNLSRKNTMDRLEFLNPLQKTIACGRKEEEGVTLIICLLGPEGNFTIFDTSFQSQATAGSKCHKGYYNDDGLCFLQIPTQEPIIDYRKMADEARTATEEPEPEPVFENHGNKISLGYLLVFLLAQLLFNI